MLRYIGDYMDKILVKDLSKKFDNQIVFSSLSFSIPYKEMTAIVGPSGSGKTTLLRILSGLDKDYEGEIKEDKKLKKSFIFQEDRLLKYISPIENILIVNEKINRKDLENDLNRLNLNNIDDKSISELSGGMKRRIALLRAFLFEFDIIFLDEPFKGLDEENKDRAISYVKDKAMDKTLILVTHDMGEIEKLDIKNIIYLT